MELQDIKPTSGQFTLESTKNTYVLHPFTLEDEIWLNETYGKELVKVFEDVNMPEIARIVYRQIEDKTDFVSRSVSKLDDDGKEYQDVIGGYKLLLRLVAGDKEKGDMIWALNETLGASRPKDEDIEEASKSKKKLKNSIGAKSSTC